MKVLEEAEKSEIMEILSSLAYSPETQEYLLGYEYFKDGNDPNPSPEFRVSRLDQNGDSLEEEISISGPVSSGLLQPTVGAGVGGRFLTLWQDGGFLTAQIYESPNYDPNGEGSVYPDPYENLVEGQNGDSAINDTLCGGSVAGTNKSSSLPWALLLGLLLLAPAIRRKKLNATNR
jgi:MYXO-CTERM domain-containing protein